MDSVFEQVSENLVGEDFAKRKCNSGREGEFMSNKMFQPLVFSLISISNIIF